MKMRATFIVLSMALATAPITSAQAGTGPSNWCHDGIGQREIPVIESPVVIAVEVNINPTGPRDLILLCYSTTPAGAPNGLSGGAIVIDVQKDTATASPSAYATLLCFPDPSGFGTTCHLPSGASAAPGDVSVSAPPSGICLVDINGSCAAYAPGLRITTGGDTQNTAMLTLLGAAVPIDVPQQCIAVLVAC